MCDVACQREKDLKSLMATYEAAEKNKVADPQAYEDARMKYFTLKDGQTWLHNEKDRIAREQVQPIVNEYSQKIQKLQAELDAYSKNSDVLGMLKASEVGDEEETRYMHNQLLLEKDKVGVARRLSQLDDPLFSFSWMPLFLNIVIAVSVIAIIYYIYIGKLTGLVAPNTL